MKALFAVLSLILLVQVFTLAPEEVISNDTVKNDTRIGSIDHIDEAIRTKKKELLEELEVFHSVKRLPKWFKEDMLKSKYLDKRNRSIRTIFDNLINAWREENAPLYQALKDEIYGNKDFLEKNETEADKKQRYDELIVKVQNYTDDDEFSKGVIDFNNSNAAYRIWNNETRLRSLQRAYDTNMTFFLNRIIFQYKGFMFRPVNQGLRELNIIDFKWRLPWFVLFNYALLQHRSWYNGTLYRGTGCDIEVFKSRVGGTIRADQILSFSKNPVIASSFMYGVWAGNGIERCYLTMNLPEHSHCAVDLKAEPVFKSLEEVLVPFNTEFKILSVVYNQTAEKPFYNITCECPLNLVDSQQIHQ